MSAQRVARLKCVQRRMLRAMCRVPRRSEETWVQWIQRATAAVEQHMRESGVEYWHVVQRRRKWKWAGRVLNMDCSRWASKVLAWTPQDGRRKIGRPCLRWLDDITGFLRANGADFDEVAWMSLAANLDEWAALEDSFANGSE